MADYQISPAALAGYYRQLGKPLLLFVVPLIGWLIYYNLTIQHGNSLTAIPVILLSLATIGFGMYRGIKQQRQVALSYRLQVEPGSITRIQLNTPTIQLHPADIARIEEDAKGDITIIAHDTFQHIYISPQISNREQLLTELASFSPIMPRTRKTLLERIAPFTGVLILGLMASFYTATNKAIVGLTGFCLLAVLLWSAWRVWYDKNTQQSSRRNLWIQLLVIISIAAGLFAKLLF